MARLRRFCLLLLSGYHARNTKLSSVFTKIAVISFYNT